LPSPNEFIAALTDLPEIRVLATCAARRRIRFWLTNTIADIYLKFHSWQGKNASLYDFVGPFDSLNIALADPDDGTQLDRAIADSLPLAGFYHWTLGPYPKESGVFPALPLDSLWLEFDGRSGKSNVQLHSTEFDPIAILEGYLRSGPSDPIPANWNFPEWYPLVLIATLRIARYWFAYPFTQSPVSEVTLRSATDRLRKSAGTADPIGAGYSFVDGIESLILGIVFSALDYHSALAWIRSLKTALAPTLLERSTILRMILEDSEMETALHVGCVLREPRQVDLHTRAGIDVEFGGPSSVIPWTPLGFETIWNNDECCRYRDFRIPPVMIVWRDTKEFRYMDMTASRFAAVARLRSSDVSLNPIYHPVPAVLFSGVSLAVRIDHGYTKAMLDESAWIDYGVIEAPLGGET
jgi:hypothetical protein